jgi:hypothetical protein
LSPPPRGRKRGLYVVPFCRNCLQSTSNLLTLDISNLVALANGVTQSSAIRDTGIGAKGYLFEDRFEYRASVFSGERTPGTNDAFRFAGRVQYVAFDTEIGYTYAGTSLGKKKILAIGAGSDNQGDYHATSADVFFDIPVFKGDAVGGQAAWFQYDGRTRFPSLPKQNDYLLELGYYLSKAHLQPFAQFQTQRFLQEANTVKNVDRYQAGFNLYIHGQNLKLTPAFTRLIPNDPRLPRRTSSPSNCRCSTTEDGRELPGRDFQETAPMKTALIRKTARKHDPDSGTGARALTWSYALRAPEDHACKLPPGSWFQIRMRLPSVASAVFSVFVP